MIEIRWQSIATKFNYVLADGRKIKLLTVKPEGLFNDYIVYESENEGSYSLATWTLHKRPVEETKPVYTQSMADNGEQIKKGMQFAFGGEIQNNGPYIAIGISKTSKGDDVLTYEYGACDIETCWINDTWVKPIDNRTDTEKASDDLDSLGYKCNISLINSIKAGKVRGMSFTGIK